MSRYTRVVVLCEDRQQELFARRFLVRCGIDSHRLHFRISSRIGVFIPKRNIETWIHYLLGNPVDESTDYSGFARIGGDWKWAVEELAVNRANPLPDNAPPSLQAACGELDRIL